MSVFFCYSPGRLTMRYADLKASLLAVFTSSKQCPTLNPTVSCYLQLSKHIKYTPKIHQSITLFHMNNCHKMEKSCVNLPHSSIFRKRFPVRRWADRADPLRAERRELLEWRVILGSHRGRCWRQRHWRGDRNGEAKHFILRLQMVPWLWKMVELTWFNQPTWGVTIKNRDWNRI